MSGESCPTGWLFWTCTDQTPSFEGCCSIYPCGGDNTGCPDDDSYPTALASTAASSSTAAASSTFSTRTTSRSARTTSSVESSSPTSSLSSSTTNLPASSSSSPTSTPTPVPSPSNSLSKTQIHAIIGGAAAGAVIVFLAIALFWTWYCSKKSRDHHVSQQPLRPAPTPFTEMSAPPSPQPRSRTPLPYIQTDLANTPRQQRTVSGYSAYSPNHITPSSFDSQFPTTNPLVSSVRSSTHHHRASHNSEEGYYPGRPIFGIPHAIQSDAGTQPRTSTISDYEGPTPPPAYVSQQGSPTSPLSPISPTVGGERVGRSTRRSANYSYPSPQGQFARNSPPAPGPPNAGYRTRRSSGPHYIPQPQHRPMLRREQGLGHEPRRKSEPPHVQPIYETPDLMGDQVPDLPSPLSAVDPRHSRQAFRRAGGVRGLNDRTVSGSALDGSSSWAGNADVDGNGSADLLVQNTNTELASTGWDGDMRTEREREREFRREREMERQRVEYEHWQRRGLTP